MKTAMILAAGRGERMRPWTDTIPKPLQIVRGNPLIGWHLENLARAGFERIVINQGWLGSKIRDYVQNGSAWGLQVFWSHEGDSPIGSAAGVRQALKLLGSEPFLLLSADIFTDFDWKKFSDRLLWPLNHPHLVLVQHDKFPVDFGLKGNQVVWPAKVGGTYANIGLYPPSFFEHQLETRDLGVLLCDAASRGELTGEWFLGEWWNIGTQQDWEQVNDY